MPLSASNPPKSDPTSIFEHFRAGFASNLLTAAVAHFRLFDVLNGRSMTFTELRGALELEERPAVVLLTALGERWASW